MKKKQHLSNKHCSPLYRSHRNIFFLLFLIFLFGISSVVFIDSRQATLEEQRKLIYGSWHIAVYNTDTSVYQSLKNHATVKSAGCMYLYGYALANAPGMKHDFSGSIGYADENVVNIGNITLLEGRLPKNKNEIAIEASFLNRAGYSYKLGQQISLTISNQNTNNSHADTPTRFILCGVIKNYSSCWKTVGNPLPSFFISAEFADELPKPVIHIFAEMESQFADDADSLLLLCDSQNTFTKNEFTYLQYSKENNSSFRFLFQQIMIVLTGFLFIVVLMNADIRQRYNSFVMIRTIGASKHQIILCFLREKLFLILSASLWGIFCGLLLPYLTFLLINKLLSTTVMYSFHVENVLPAILLLYGGLMLSIMLSLISLFQVPLRGIATQQTAQKKSHSHRKKHRYHSLFSLFQAADRRQRFFQAALTFTSTALIYFLAYQSQDAYSVYLQHQIDYPYDYSFGLLAVYSPPETVMSEDSLEQIKQTYGVKEVYSFSVSDYYGISFPSSYDKNYTKEVSAYLSQFVANLPNAQICGAFIGISDNLLPVFMNELDSGTPVETLAENEVILYLPNYYKQPDGSLLIEKDAIKAAPGTKLLSEHTVSVGDTIRVDANHSIKELKIAGIIRSFEDTTPLSCNPMRPFSIICQRNTFCNMTGQDDYAYVLVNRNAAAIPYQTDVELSKIQTGLYFDNIRMEHQEQAQNLFVQLILSLLFCVFIFTVTFILKFNAYSSWERQKSHRYKLLYQLGMSKSMLIRNLSANAFLHCIFGCVLSAAAFLLFRFIQEGRTMLTLADYEKPDTVRFLLDISIQFIHYTKWNFFLIFSAGIFLLHFLILWIHDYRNVYHNNC